MKTPQHRVTPDGRYFVVRGRLWRCTDPSLSEARRQELIKQLMEARRTVRAARESADVDALKQARATVHTVKVALGERGPVWWKDGADDYNRRLAVNTPYANWYGPSPE